MADENPAQVPFAADIVVDGTILAAMGEDAPSSSSRSGDRDDN